MVLSEADSRIGIAGIARLVADFVFPPRCAICGAESESGYGDAVPETESLDNVCRTCAEQIAPVPDNRCERCSAPAGPYLDTSAGCIHCIGDVYSFERVYSLGVYRNRLRTAVLSAKHGGGSPTAAALARVFCEREQARLQPLDIDVVIPVPHHWVERATRRHLPPVTMSRLIADRLKTRWLGDALKKVRWTPKQVSLNPTERRRNLRGAFRVGRRARLKGKRILLVDDVLTTGTTAQRATRVLKQAGAGPVYAAVIARGVGDSSDR